MPLPLYPCSAPKNRGNGHPGLWYDKFCSEWRSANGFWSLSAESKGKNEPSPKFKWIGKVTDRVVGDSLQIREAVERLAALAEALKGRFWVYETRDRFVTGLGRSHPIENGFAWHHTLGTPYLPGSSLKGMVRAWAKEEKVPTNEVARIFGPEKAGAAGEICFFDALPVHPVILEADVMTPHYAGWAPQDPPGDWLSPNPIPFLAVAQGAKFLFVAAPRKPEAAADVSKVEQWLDQALHWAGAGAKTAVGYGRMTLHRDETARWREAVSKRGHQREQKQEAARKLAAMSPIEREIEELRQRPENKGQDLDVILFQELQTSRWSISAQRREVALWAKLEMEKTGTWRPQSTKPQKDKAHKRTVYILSVLEGTKDVPGSSYQ